MSPIGGQQPGTMDEAQVRDLNESPTRGRTDQFPVQKSLTRAQLLDGIVSVPDAPGERWFNADLRQMARPELEMERARLRLRLVMEDKPSWWLLERLAAIERELVGVPA